MKQLFILLLCSLLSANCYSQTITLLYRGPSGWDDPNSWIQLNAPVGQTPISRVPLHTDDVVFSNSMSGYGGFTFQEDVSIGGGTGSICRSMRVSGMIIYFLPDYPNPGAMVDVYTINGGYFLADSGANIRRGIFTLHGGNPAITDMQIINSSYGELHTHATWSSIILTGNSKARFINSHLEGWNFSNNSPTAALYADGCDFNIVSFTTAANTNDSLFNCTFKPGDNFVSLNFTIGPGANFVSDNLTVSSRAELNFITSGSVFNGNLFLEHPGYLFLGQIDAANPLPNIINGNITIPETYGTNIKGDLKISGDLIFNMPYYSIYDTTTIFVNGIPIFVVGDLQYLNNNHCTIEFFGTEDSYIKWPLGFPIDTLVVNKSACAKVNFENSLYVLGKANIQQGQLALVPNDGIPFKFVCLGDLEVMQGGGVFLKRNNFNNVAGMAIQGNIFDYNPVADSTCAGISNPYFGDITLYRNFNNNGNKTISVQHQGLANLHLFPRPGSGYILGTDLTVYDSFNVNAGELNLNNYKLTIKKLP